MLPCLPVRLFRYLELIPHVLKTISIFMRPNQLKVYICDEDDNSFFCFYSPEFGTEKELRKIFSWESSVEQYTTEGGTSKSAVSKQIESLEQWIKDITNKILI